MNDANAFWRSAAYALIAAITVWRIIYLAAFSPLDLAPDEAYYWTWSRQLDWCYHSKGPLVAWLIRASCEVLGNTPFAVRFPATLCGGLLLLGLQALARDVYRCDRLAMAVVCVAATLPIVAAGSMLMTIDAPFTCAWVWALVFGHRAVTGESTWLWIATGACVILGVLAKHSMVLWLGSFVLFLAATPECRAQFTRRGFWIMTLLAALGAVPIIAWNLVNGWVTLDHTRMHAGMEAADGVHWFGPIHFVGTQFVVLLGFWFVIWAWAMWSHRPMCEVDPSKRFLWWMSAPTFVFFAVFSVTNGGGEANWPIPAYLSGSVLAAGWLACEIHNTADWRRRLIIGGGIASVALGLVVVVVFHEPIRTQPLFLHIAGPATERHPAPIRRVDPTARLRGWRYLAMEVDRFRGSLGSRSIEPVLAAERWTHASELSFYCDGRPAWTCLALVLGDRASQFDLWRPNPICEPSAYRGRTFLIVGLDLKRLRSAFESMESPQSIEYREGDGLVASWEIAVGRGFRGWDVEERKTK